MVVQYIEAMGATTYGACALATWIVMSVAAVFLGRSVFEQLLLLAGAAFGAAMFPLTWAVALVLGVSFILFDASGREER